LPIRVFGKSTHFEKMDFSSIPFGPIMRLAKHFAVGTFGGTALTPSSHVVGIHFSKFPNFILVCIVGYDIVRAVGKFIFWGFIHLLLASSLFPSFSKNSYIE
jgi:hypothetical protein